MVTKWGLSEVLGPIMYDEDDGEVFLGMSAGVKPKPISGATAKAIDEEVRRIVEQCYTKARSILVENEDKLHTMAESLIEYETLNPDQIEDIMAGAEPRAPSDEPSGVQSATVDQPARSEDEKGSGPIGGPAEET